MTAKARSGRTIVVKNRVYRIAQPKLPITAGGLRLAPKPKDWSFCQACGSICNRHNMTEHQTNKHLRIHDRHKCGKAESFKTIQSFMQKYIEDKDGNIKLIKFLTNVPLCCATTCGDCRTNKPADGQYRCESCNKRHHLATVGIRYTSNIRPETVALLRRGLPPLKINR